MAAVSVLPCACTSLDCTSLDFVIVSSRAKVVMAFYERAVKQPMASVPASLSACKRAGSMSVGPGLSSTAYPCEADQAGGDLVQVYMNLVIFLQQRELSAVRPVQCHACSILKVEIGLRQGTEVPQA